MDESKKRILSYLAIVIGIIVVLHILLVAFNLGKDMDIEDVVDKGQVEKANESGVKSNITEGNLSKIEVKIPAVNEMGEGVPTSLVVERDEGSGRTLTDIKNILFWADTQQSIRMARLVAENVTGIDPDRYDLIYSIQANASLIGGPSAGAAITIATIGALTGGQPNKSVMMTGRVNHDGSLGPVSRILKKAKAADKTGADLFLVPLLQSRDVIYREEEHCEEFGHTKICQTETYPVKIDVANETGIKVKEVSSIREAQEYFF